MRGMSGNKGSLMGYFLLCAALIAALYWVKLGIDDAIFWERKFKRVIQDFKDAKTVEEFYQKIKQYM